MFENILSLKSTEFPRLCSSTLSLTLTNDGNHSVRSVIPDKNHSYAKPNTNYYQKERFEGSSDTELTIFEKLEIPIPII